MPKKIQSSNAKEKQGEWNDRPLEYRVKQKILGSLTCSIIPLLQYSRTILSDFGICHSFGI
jgi:hypothetical protein